jgi:hypothetical protein
LHEEERRSLFQKYFQTQQGQKFTGTGLGLSICRQLVNLMGGDIGVDSVPKVGSNFWFTLDLEPCQAAEVSHNTEVHFQALFTGRVLIAEDQPVNQRVAMKFLEKLGLQVDLASNGQQALEKLATGSYDLVFMDCQMPVMTGYEATRTIRANESSEDRRQTIIALTAEGTSGERSSCFEAGMDAFLTKPLVLRDLISVLQQWLPAHAAKDLIEFGLDETALAKLEEHTVKDQSLVTLLIEDFEASVPVLLGQMHTALQNADPGALGEAAHALKGTSATLGVRRMLKLCEDLENVADLNGQTTSEVAARVSELEKEFLKAKDDLSSYSTRGNKAA